jgi:hypothetical protein
LSWFQEDGFYDMIAKEWNGFVKGHDPIQIWKNKIHHLRQFLRGWAQNSSGVYKKEKERLLSIIDRLDIKAKSSPLSMSE